MKLSKLPRPIGLFTLVMFYATFVAANASAVVIGLEDFDGGAVNLVSTSNVFDFGAGGGTGGDAFGRVEYGVTGAPFDVADDSVADTSGGGLFTNDLTAVAGQTTSAFFTLNDSDGFGSLNDATWHFDISSAPRLQNIQIDLAAFGDFEALATDGFEIQARIDANPYQTIFLARTNEAVNKTYRPFDDGDVFTLEDPLQLFIDGAPTAFGLLDKSNPITGAFDTYTSTLFAGAAGSTLDVKLSWAGIPSSLEPQGIDNITIHGIPEPATCVLLAIGVAGIASIRRRGLCA